MGLLRLLLALSVLRAHTGTRLLGLDLVPSDIAVESFYIISGFYMAMVLNEKYARTQDYGAFLQQRFFRLYPTYFTILLITLVVEIAGTYAHGQARGILAPFAEHSLDPFAFLFFVATNLVILGQDVVMFIAINPHGAMYFTPDFYTEPTAACIFLAVPQAWSLGLEIGFYLLAPFIVRRSTVLQLTLLLLGLALRFAFGAIWNLRQDPWSYRFLPFEISFFVLGSLAYRAYRSRQALYAHALPYARWLRWLFVLVLCFYSAVFGDSQPWDTVLFILWAMLIPIFFLETRSSAWDKLLGELSYPLYLCHIFVINHLRDKAAHLPLWSQGAFYALAALLVSYPICRWVDYPVERFRHRLAAYRNLATVAPRAGTTD